MMDGKFEKEKVNLLKVPARSCPTTAIVSRGKKKKTTEIFFFNIKGIIKFKIKLVLIDLSVSKFLSESKKSISFRAKFSKSTVFLLILRNSNQHLKQFKLSKIQLYFKNFTEVILGNFKYSDNVKLH